MPAGELVVTNPRTIKTKLYALDYAARTPRGELALSPSAQQEHRVLHGTASVEAGDPADQRMSTFEFIDTAMITAMRRGPKAARKDRLRSP